MSTYCPGTQPRRNTTSPDTCRAATPGAYGNQDPHRSPLCLNRRQTRKHSGGRYIPLMECTAYHPKHAHRLLLREPMGSQFCPRGSAVRVTRPAGRAYSERSRRCFNMRLRRPSWSAYAINTNQPQQPLLPGGAHRAPPGRPPTASVRCTDITAVVLAGTQMRHTKDEPKVLEA